MARREKKDPDLRSVGGTAGEVGLYAWQDWPRERLLDTRLCDLGLVIPGSPLESRIERVLGELRRRNVRFRPHFWLSDEWFSPSHVPGVAIPFYLAHPRLTRIERAEMFEVEGASRDECLRLLRHEVGHAIHEAYQLHRLRRWQRVFGNASNPYPDEYRPNPASKRYVQHLGAWYAQSHPIEDFAETFAVWLRPRSNWRRRYANWAALMKLEFVDTLMGEIGGRPPKSKSRARPSNLSGIRVTLREYYRAKRERYTVGFHAGYDRDLRRLFSSEPTDRNNSRASSFLRRHRREIRGMVARWTGEYQFTLDHVLTEMIGRCRELGLRVVGDEQSLKIDFAILLTVHTMTRLYRTREWHKL